MKTAITLHTIDDEPRIRDRDLALKLGYGRPLKLRELIIRRSKELVCYGALPVREKAAGPQERRPTVEYFLNECQAIRVATLADTIDTVEVCEIVIKAYSEHRRSQLSAPALTPDMAAILPILQQMAEMMAILMKRIGQS